MEFLKYKFYREKERRRKKSKRNEIRKGLGNYSSYGSCGEHQILETLSNSKAS